MYFPEIYQGKYTHLWFWNVVDFDSNPIKTGRIGYLTRQLAADACQQYMEENNLL